MDFKKIKPNDILGYLDELVAKIPESISTLLTKIMIAILVLSLCYAGYWGYKQGQGSATQEGQELAKDTKSLFLEDIEREYNRKRKNIRMPSADDLIDEEIYKTPKQYESYGRSTETNSILPPSDSLLENDKSIRSYKRKEGTSPLAELYYDSVPTQDSPNPSPDREQKPKRKLQIRDNFDSPYYGSKELNSALDQVNTESSYEKKILTKKDSNKIKQNDSVNIETNNSKKYTDKSLQKEDRKGKLIPLDGNE